MHKRFIDGIAQVCVDQFLAEAGDRFVFNLFAKANIFVRADRRLE